MADTRPAKLIQGIMTIEQDTATLSDPLSPWFGYPIAWRIKVDLTPQTTSYPGERGDFSYNAQDIIVGDWVASNAGAIAVKITEIVEVVNDTTIILIVEDDDLYNTYADAGLNGSSIGPAGRCLVFEVADDGMPVLSPTPANYLDSTFQGDLFSRFFYMNKLAGGGGGSDVLTAPTDGSYVGGQYPWVIGTTKVMDAFDNLNDGVGEALSKLAKLLPSGPPNLSAKSLSIAGAANTRAGVDILLASSVPLNDVLVLPVPTPGTKVLRSVLATAVSDIVQAFGNADSGVLTAKVNSIVKGTKTLTTGNDTGTYQSLQITNDYGYPLIQPDFWNALDARVSNVVDLGINRFELTHSTAGAATPVIFVTDNLTAGPSTTAVTVAEGTPGTLVYSSGVPHYQAGASLKGGSTNSGLAGQTYMAQKVIQFTTNPLIGSLDLNPGQGGIPAILVANQAPVVVTNQTVPLAGVAHTTSVLRGRSSNPNADSTYSDSTTKINYMSGVPATGMIDAGRPMSGVTLKRIKMGTGSRPADVVTTFAGSSFDPGSSAGLGDAANTWEAATVGGVTRCDQNNYTLYLPEGPDYSSRPAIQYATFIIKKVASSMSFTFTGVDPSEVWIKLPGLAVSMPSATNGWWDAKKAADFAPGRWPGDTGASDGCLTQKNVLTYNVSFGSASSAGANDNIVMIRVVLTAGQLISNLNVVI